MIHFIGLGAQKSGTSWIYANLYEHPQICIPIKEIHFFSRDRYREGREWYENHFKKCQADAICGEFSTSYLYTEQAPQRIKELYPTAKLIAVLREPVARAYSQYRNAIKAGEISEEMTFDAYAASEPSVFGQGMYATQIERYLRYFDRSQLLILIYEDIDKNPEAFMRNIYAFLGVDTAFVSSMLHTQVNTARTPKAVGIDRLMHRVAEGLRSAGFDRIVHAIKKSGITDRIRSLNTKKPTTDRPRFNREDYGAQFTDEVRRLSKLTNRDLGREWNIPV